MQLASVSPSLLLHGSNEQRGFEDGYRRFAAQVAAVCASLLRHPIECFGKPSLLYRIRQTHHNVCHRGIRLHVRAPRRNVHVQSFDTETQINKRLYEVRKRGVFRDAFFLQLYQQNLSAFFEFLSLNC